MAQLLQRLVSGWRRRSATGSCGGRWEPLDGCRLKWDELSRKKMDSNKEESERCIRLAEKFLQYSDIEQALKYLYKAERLYPSQRAKGETPQ